MSTRDTILDTVTALLVSANVAGGNVARMQREQIAEDSLPFVNVEWDGDEAVEASLGRIDHDLGLVITAYAKDATGTASPDHAPDATLLAAHTALMADLTLGLGVDVQLNPNYSVVAPRDDSFDYGALAHRYVVFYRSAPNAY